MTTARATTATIAKAIARFEPVSMLVNPANVAAAAFACGPSVEIVEAELDDSWLRDTGPVFLRDGHGIVEAACFGFNGWGRRYPDIERDQAISAFVAGQAGARWHRTNMILEGGSIQSDGEGTLLTTEQCLLNPNRNRSMERGRIERTLKSTLGVSEIVWLPEGLPHDHADGHVDNVAAFVRPGVVATIGGAQNAANRQRLKDARDAQGRAFEVIELPPAPVVEGDDGAPLPLSYVNFYIANGGVVMPGFGDHKTDMEALMILRDAFPKHTVVQVQAQVMGHGGGGIHAVALSQPLSTYTPS